MTDFTEKNRRRREAKRIWGRDVYRNGRRLRRMLLINGAFGRMDERQYMEFAVGTVGQR